MDGYLLTDYFDNYFLCNDTPGNDRVVYKSKDPDGLGERLHRIAPTDKAKHILLLATLATLTKNCSSYDDILLFTPIYKDNAVQADRALVPVRIRRHPSCSFKELVGALKEDVIRDLTHAGGSTCQMLGCDEKQLENLFEVGLLVEGLHERRAFDTSHPGLLFYFDTGKELSLSLEYFGAGANKEILSRLAGMYFGLLNTFISDAGTKLSASVHPADGEDCLRETMFTGRLWEQLGKRGEWTAIRYGDERVSYKELDDRSGRLADLLKKRGVGSSSLVALLIPERKDAIVGILGILRTGAAYLPVNLQLPKDRIDYILNDSDAQYILSTQGYEGYAGGRGQVILMNEIPDSDGNIPFTMPVCRPSDPCCVLYTTSIAGNTQRLLYDQENAERIFFNTDTLLSFSDSDRWLMSHDHWSTFHFYEIFGALLSGGTIVIPWMLQLHDAVGYWELIAEASITVVNHSPWEFFELICREQPCRHTGHPLRYVLLSGQPFSPVKLKEWKLRNLFLKIIHLYWAGDELRFTAYKEIGDAEIINNSSTMGKAAPGLVLYVLDNNQKQVQRGMAGKLFVGGAGWLYDSGDRVRLMDNDQIEFLGRVDGWQPINGRNIRIADMESRLMRHTAVVNAAIVLRNNILIAFFSSGSIIDSTELRGFLADIPAAGSLPMYFVQLDRFPLNVDGKPDTPALLCMAGEYREPDTDEHPVAYVSFDKEVYSF
jgi:acyl-coenzyme A synthetase/AMP-(fatty) acid ligase